MWVAVAHGAAAALVVAEQQQRAARNIAEYGARMRARMQERKLATYSARFPPTTCAYCGSAHYEQRCPSCGAPRRKHE